MLYGAELRNHTFDFLAQQADYIANVCNQTCSDAVSIVAEADVYGIVSNLSTACSGSLAIGTIFAALRRDNTAWLFKGCGSLALSFAACRLNPRSYMTDVSFVAGVIVAAAKVFRETNAH